MQEEVREKGSDEEGETTENPPWVDELWAVKVVLPDNRIYYVFQSPGGNGS